MILFIVMIAIVIIIFLMAKRINKECPIKEAKPLRKLSNKEFVKFVKQQHEATSNF